MCVRKGHHAVDETCARFEHEWLHGDRALARRLAREHVAAQEPRLATVLGGHPLEALVTLIDGHREAGRHEARVEADMWLLDRFPPQHITGAIRIGVDNVTAFARDEVCS